MSKKIIKARLIWTVPGLMHVLIYAAGRWRLFATPYSPKAGRTSPYKTKTQARKGAESTAKALGITLEWEE